MRLEPLDRLHANHALVLGLVGEERRTGNVANRIDTGYIRAIECIDYDSAALSLNPELLQTEIFDIPDDADRGDNALGRQCLCGAFAGIDCRGDTIGRLVQLRHFGAGQDVDALFFGVLYRNAGDLRVLGGTYLWLD